VGKQVNFYLLPSDFTTVQAAIESAGPVKFLTDRTRDDRPREIDSLVVIPDEMGRMPLRVYAVRPEDLHSVKTKWIEQQGHWIIDQFDSPVLEIDRCYYDGRVIRRGRIYFATDLRFRPAFPDKDFVRWGTAVLGRVRRRLLLNRQLHSFAYISEAVLSWLHAHGGTFEGDVVTTTTPEDNDPYLVALATRARYASSSNPEEI
jgi:hypothetical protein